MKKSVQIFLLTVSAGILATVHFMDLQQHQALILGGWLGLAVFIVLLVVDFTARKRLDLVHIFLFGAILRVGIGGIYAGVVLGSEHSEFLSTMGHLPTDSMYAGLKIMQSGTLAAMLGFVAFDNRKLHRELQSGQMPAYPPTYQIFATAIAGWGLKFLNMNGFPGLGVLGYAICMLPDVALFIFVLLGIAYRRGRGLHWFLSGLIILVQFYFARQSTMRETYAFMVLPVLLAFAVSLNQQSGSLGNTGLMRPGKIKIARLIPFGIISAVIFYFFLTIILPAATRVKQRESTDIKAAVSEILEEKREKIVNDDFPDKGIYALPFRMSVLTVAPAIIVELRADDYRMESGPMENFAAAFIPRVLWKDKPNISKGLWFAQFLNPASWNTRTSIAMTAPGEFYWAYGWLGMITAMFLFGGALRIFWNYLLPRIKYQPAAVLTFIVLCQECFRWFESEFSRPMSLVTLLFILTYILIRFILKGRKRIDMQGAEQ